MDKIPSAHCNVIYGPTLLYVHDFPLSVRVACGFALDISEPV